MKKQVLTLRHNKAREQRHFSAEQMHAEFLGNNRECSIQS